MFIFNSLYPIWINCINSFFTLLSNQFILVIGISLFLGISYFIFYSKGLKEGLKIVRDLSVIGASGVSIYKTIGGGSGDNDQLLFSPNENLLKY